MKKIRRIVVGQNANNKSAILEDSYAKDIKEFISGVDDAVSINLWATNSSPANLKIDKDPTESEVSFLPKTSGSIFRVCVIPPDDSYIYRLDEILLNGEKVTEKQKKGQHPLMHKVDALVYGIILEGKVTLLTDTENTELKKGDTVIDCGSHHAWSNQTDSNCKIAFILIDAVR
jgi:hypothetical protein